MKKVVLLMLTLFALTGVVNCYAAGSIELKMATFLPRQDRNLTAWWAFVKAVNEKAKGELKIKYVGGPEAVPPFKQFEALRSGVLDIIFGCESYYGRQVTGFAYTHLSRLTPWEERQNGYYDFRVQLLKKHGVFYLGRPLYGTWFHVFTNKFVRRPQELKGQKIRVSATYEPFIRRLGAVPITLPGSDVYTALERGTIKTRGLSLRDFLRSVEIIVHGTTVTTNAVLTGNISKTGLLTTKGFRDALQMRRGIREELYNNKYLPPNPLVPRYLRLPVDERVDYAGNIVRKLNPTDVYKAMEIFKEKAVEAIAICFMHSYANNKNELEAERIVKETLPDVYVSVSCRVLPQVRFYKRLSTTVLNAAVGPILRRYLEALTKKLSETSFKGILLIMQSNGGVTSPQIAVEMAASTLLSGPAAAPVAGLIYASVHNFNNFITIDMGGTSFDACLIKDASPLVTTGGMPGIRFKIIGRADDMLIVKGVNVYPEAIKAAILQFRPKVTGFFRIVLDKPGPLVTPPLRIKLEYSSSVQDGEIPSLEEQMVRYFKENLRISPKFIWVKEGSIPREMKKTKFIEIDKREQ